MNQNAANPRVAVMGAGAVGSYFGGMLARAGMEVTLIGRAAHVEAIKRDGLLLNTATFQERVRIGASTKPEAVSGADFVLFSVKTKDTENASRGLAPFLSPRAILISVQNGVDNVERIRSASGIEAVPAVVYIAVALPEPGHVKHSARGELVIGELGDGANPGANVSDRCRRVCELFASAGVPCRISADLEVDMWTKFMRNCAGNAVSAIAQTTYGAATREPHTREVMARLIEETVAVARASGVRLPQVNFVEDVLEFMKTIDEAISSTAQDIARGKPTEIDDLNGLVVRRGAELGIPTPVNFTVHALIKLLESKNQSQNPAAI